MVTTSCMGHWVFEMWLVQRRNWIFVLFKWTLMPHVGHHGSLEMENKILYDYRLITCSWDVNSKQLRACLIQGMWQLIFTLEFIFYFYWDNFMPWWKEEKGAGVDELEKGGLLEQGCPNQSVCERLILTRLQMLYWSLKTMLIIVLLPILLLLLLLKNSVHYPNTSVFLSVFPLQPWVCHLHV